MEAFQNITYLILRGGRNVTIAEDGTIKGVDKVIQSEHILILESYSICRDFGFCVNGNISIGDTLDSIQSRYDGDSITVNGVRIDTNRLHEILAVDNYKLGENCLINTVSVDGTSGLSQLPTKFVDKRTFNVYINGSGDVNLPANIHFQKMKISIAGNGDVNCNGITLDTAMITTSGHGNVKGLHIIDSDISIEKSGIILITLGDSDNVK